MKKLNVLDLFCGAGGLSKGFADSGYKILGGLDIDSEAMRTYAQNFGKAFSKVGDIAEIRGQDLRDLTQESNVDVIVGGPPCQGFSIAGKRLEEDPRNSLYREYLRLVRTLKPRAIVIENVPTIMSLYGGRVASEIIEDLEKIGYSVSVSKLWAADFGVPQLRRRAIFVALRTKSINFQFPDPTTPDRKLTCWDAISDLPTLRSNPGSDESEYQNDPRSPYQEVMRRNSKVLYNHWAVIHKAQTIETISLVPDGGNYKDLPIELQRTRNVNIAWTRMNSKKPCFTIDAGHNHHFHYRENRVPTVRESARIQSFPDNFRFVGKKTSQFRQVGNAVPPLLALAIADQLKGYLK